MKIYTRGGDDGTTSLMGGRRLPKFDVRIESYGTVDELIAWIGLLRGCRETAEFESQLLYLQGQLMSAAAALATDPQNPPRNVIMPEERSIEVIESLIDRMEESLPELKTFILPGGNQTSSFCHIARCVCRRAERAVVKLDSREKVSPVITRLLNRTSDMLFVLGRYTLQISGSHDIKWER
jgi:cob(I)alamin adenosyltransferase